MPVSNADEIKLRDIMLQTVNNVANLLLQSEIEEFDNVLWRCMGMMARAVDADRMRLWKNHRVNGKLYCTQINEWAGGVEPQQGRAHTIEVSYDDTLPGWEEKLSHGQCVNDLVKNMSNSEKKRFSSQGILSILIVPVFLSGEFWGFVGFNDCHKERLYTANEESILRSGSLLIASALLRNEMTLGLRDAAAKLETALEETRAASQSKSNFLSNMSHEMRTPMNAIIGMTMIGKAAEDVEKKDYAFEKIGDASNHLLGVINDILDMSKIEANKFELSFIEFNFEKMVQRVTNIINFRLEEKQQKFSLYLDPAIPPSLIGDDLRISQVITNLLANAVKFTHDNGSITLDLRLIKKENELYTIQVNVTDTGIGINAEQQPRLFTSFEQAESSTSRKFGGTGLGLAISKRIVELMGGKIWVKSKYGQGSTFSFTIQLKAGKEKPTDTPASVEQNQSMDSQNGAFRGRRLLLAEDVEINREIVEAMLLPLGFEIDFAVDGAEAVRMFKANSGSYDLIFMDVQMPEMDGFEATRRIRYIESGSSERIPIIAMTANVFREDIKKCLEAGMDDHLGKPLDFADVMEILKIYLQPRLNQGAL